MSWLDTFKNDERSLYWLAKYILGNNLTSVKKSPTNIEEASEIIQCWENESINGAAGRIQFEQSKLMKGYLSNILPTENFDWLSVKDPKQLCWVLFYLKFNPPKRYYYAPPNKYFRDFASNVKEVYPLIIKIFDDTFCDEGVKQDYLLTMKESYSQFVTGKSRLPWLDIKDEETCSWVWRYLTERIDKAAEENRAFQFIKPIDNETIYWSVIALISNWNFLNGIFTEEVKHPRYSQVVELNSTKTPMSLFDCDSQTFKENSNETEDTLFNNTPLTIPSNISSIDGVKINSTELVNVADESCLIYTDSNYPYEKKSKSDIYKHDTNRISMVTLEPIGGVYIPQKKVVNLEFSRTSPTSPDLGTVSNFESYRISVKSKLPKKEELISSLYNAYKQRLLRKQSNSPFGLSKANQKKLTNYAKDQNTTEKKALNEIVKTMLD
ncbi:hypothetical protein NQU96_05675 [Pseudoalteromonas elyakovii]|nr:hypothetical protein [Pseudoalteromonas elyakovii]